LRALFERKWWFNKQGGNAMSDQNSTNQKIILAAGLGALVGGIAVLLATQAIPKMMAQMREGMMQNMMEKMKERGCTPSEM
jgi:hypothetical protein